MKIVVTIIVMLAGLAAGALILMYSGAYEISALNHDNAVVNWVLDTGMTRSVRYHARGIKAPDLSDPAMVRLGFEHYNEMCVSCHGAPGVKPSEIGDGLWPTAPDLADTVKEWKSTELFWITKNGIKFTAMPAWGPSHTDEQIWDIVAFLEKLPALSSTEYKEMTLAAERTKQTEPKP